LGFSFSAGKNEAGRASCLAPDSRGLPGSGSSLKFRFPFLVRQNEAGRATCPPTHSRPSPTSKGSEGRTISFRWWLPFTREFLRLRDLLSSHLARNRVATPNRVITLTTT